ncbi:30S ribosomal protein S8e [Candidatus Bathyarchaeota archaeon]|nr:MAG: 30S ribosomal protein S8e [Candidatus Bathyarchaeota archaeon]TMI29618.1 MAG: 30S ribosomal protein S8e [Candidatus Bathyarchaeota archaeon]
MPQSHGGLHKKKPTGGKKRRWRGKRAFEAGSEPTETLVGPTKQRYVRTFGGHVKVRLAAAEYATITDQGTGKSSKSKILRVIRNPANVDYQRRGVITKGAIISTEAGEARVTSRPGQHGVVNAILQKAAEKP